MQNLKSIIGIMIIAAFVAIPLIAYELKPIETEIEPGFTLKLGLIYNDDYAHEATGNTIYDFGYQIGTNKTLKGLYLNPQLQDVVEQTPTPSNEFMFVYGALPVNTTDIVSFRAVIEGDTVPVGIYYVERKGIVAFTPIYGDDSYTPYKDGCEPGDTVFIYLNKQKCREFFEYSGNFQFRKLVSLTLEE